MELVQKRVAELLRKMGFSEYEANAYIILAFSGPLSAVEVAEFTKIPRPRTYDIIQRLCENGFAAKAEGKPVRYNAIPPSELVKLLEKEDYDKAAALHKTCGELVEQLSQAYEKVAPEEGVSYTIKGVDNLIQTFVEMLNRARRAGVLTSSTHSFVMKRPEVLKGIRNPKLDLRIIAERMTANIPVAKVKTYSVSDKFGMVLVDGRECLFLTVEGESHEYNLGCYIRDPKMCRGFETAFEVLWHMV